MAKITALKNAPDMDVAKPLCCVFGSIEGGSLLLIERFNSGTAKPLKCPSPPVPAVEVLNASDQCVDVKAATDAAEFLGGHPTNSSPTGNATKPP
jgi:hypothetical protein